ncbi:hypothetical protein ACF09I_18155 [Streptomyces sp. NPDC014940]|uniref:hypothetical protein n=1 Tax=Streptomyces sp. NPDC014940 TaxID=3364932 RepID=UPI0036FB7879
MVQGFHGPVAADRGGELGRAGLVSVEAGDGVDRLPGFAPAGLPAAAANADGRIRSRPNPPPRLQNLTKPWFITGWKALEAQAVNRGGNGWKSAF